MRRFFVALCIGLCTPVWPLPAAQAASVDPALRWRTLKTPHFELHFHQGIEAVADEAALAAERAYDQLVPIMRWAPKGRIQLTLIDRTDVANGSARVVPYPAITLYVTAPQADSTLALYRDWNEALLVHELTHVLHLDTNHGVVRATRTLIGTIASTNSLSPGWVTEGQATMNETRYTAGGRGRAPTVEAILAATVHDGLFPPLSNLDGYQVAPPGGNLRYLFGEDFMSFIADQHGEDVWTRWNHIYGSSIPYLLPGKLVFGEGIPHLYHDWREDLTARVAARVEAVQARGETQSTGIGPLDASCSAPAFSPDGARLVFSCVDQRTGPALWEADGAGENAHKLLQDRSARSLVWRPDSEALLYAGTHVVNRFNLWSDIYLLKLDGSPPIPLTAGARATDPALSPNGQELWVVTNQAQTNQLERITVDRRRERLTDFPSGTQLGAPRFAPDGQSVAVSVWQEGRRDLWLLDLHGQPLRQLTADVANDREPAFSTDGRWLYFTSDRTGIPNIFAIELATEALFQVTNVVTAAQRPSPHPSGARLAFEQLSGDGWEVRVMDLDPNQFFAAGTLPGPVPEFTPLRQLISATPQPLADSPGPADLPSLPGRDKPRWQPLPNSPLAQSETANSYEQVDIPGLWGTPQPYDFHFPVHGYRPWKKLLPRYVLPYLQTTPFGSSSRWGNLPFGVVATLATGASDPLSQLAWSGSASYRTDVDYLGFSGAVTYNRWLPTFSLAVSGRADPTARYLIPDPEGGEDALGRPNVLADPQGRFYWEQRHLISATVSWPYTPRSTIFARYGLLFRAPLFDIPSDIAVDRLPIQGRLGSISAGWRYSWSQPTARSISREDGRILSLVGSLTHPWAGTRVNRANGEPEPLTQVQLTAELREYIVNPLIPNHVLALRAATGLSVGSNNFLGNWQLGGPFGDGAFYVTPDASWMLRGYPLGADIGDRFWLTSAEYRLPLVWIERGPGVIPTWARSLSAAAFIDAGNAFTEVQTIADPFRDPLVGVGAELSADAVLGWNALWSVRLGWATALTPGGYGLLDSRSVYLQLGSTF